MGEMAKRLLVLGIVLFAARLFAQSPADDLALRGTLITPSGIVEKGTVLIRQGKIAAVGPKVKVPENVLTIETNGIIAPGLIDLHNHLTWNVFPRWHPNQEFGSRYDWQKKEIYQTILESPHASMVAEGLECEMERYAEIKAISEGETSAVGSLADACSQGLVHNLDTEDEFQVAYNVFPLRMTDSETAAVRQRLENHQLHAFLIHLCEGSHTDASSAHEFTVLKDRGLLIPGVAIIHGVALKPENFTEMAAHGVSLIWSPRSNLELYGNTADVAAAKAAHVQIALSPDWSPTGSDGLLAELNYAAAWNETQTPHPFTDRELVAMATSIPAAITELSNRLGSLEVGHDADLLVIRPETAGPKHDAWWTLTHATAAQVTLVTIDGEPVWGDAELLDKLSPSHPVERVEVCGINKAVLFTGLHGRVDEADETWAHTTATLQTSLRHFGRNLAPLAECGQ
ncbi:MAG TPA: amidohydrolase family protein [Acidobacteriaceae bacterium]|nr:amidohydrolase family protein [Acidobacteriaceae bacterium]